LFSFLIWYDMTILTETTYLTLKNLFCSLNVKSHLWLKYRTNILHAFRRQWQFLCYHLNLFFKKNLFTKLKNNSIVIVCFFQNKESFKPMNHIFAQYVWCICVRVCVCVCCVCVSVFVCAKPNYQYKSMVPLIYMSTKLFFHIYMVFTYA